MASCLGVKWHLLVVLLIPVVQQILGIKVHVLQPGFIQKGIRKTGALDGDSMSNLTTTSAPEIGELNGSSNSFAEISHSTASSKPPVSAGAESRDSDDMDIHNWVELFLRARFAEKGGVPASLNPKIQVRLISGATGKAFGYGTRPVWSDLDIWMSGITNLKEDGLVASKLYEDHNNMQIHPAWAGIEAKSSEEIAKLPTLEEQVREKKLQQRRKTWESYRAYAQEYIRQHPGNKSLPGSLARTIEIDAWEPPAEPHKIITDFLYTYWQNKGEMWQRPSWSSGKSRKGGSHGLFELWIDGPAASLPFKIAMMSGARQRFRGGADPYGLLEPGFGTRSEPINFKVTDTYDIVYIFCLLVQSGTGLKAYNDYVEHVVAQSSEADPKWVSDTVRNMKFKGGTVPGKPPLAAWMSLYTRYNMPFVFHEIGLTPGVHHIKTPQSLFNSLVNEAAMTAAGIEDSVMKEALEYSFGDYLRIDPVRQRSRHDQVFWNHDDPRLAVPPSELLKRFTQAPGSPTFGRT